MKKAPEETMQEFSTHFLKVYNSIPAEVKPPPGVAQLRYADSFENDFSLLLRERRSANLDAIMSNVVKVEVNMMASRKNKTKVQPRRQETPGRCVVHRRRGPQTINST
jgi:hypothetical protein